MKQRNIGRLAGLVCVGALSAAGCTTMEPETLEQRYGQLIPTAAGSAGAGTATGLLMSRRSILRKQRALAGDGLGVLAASGVGAYQDRQENVLRARLRDTGVSVIRAGQYITLIMPGDIAFSSNGADLRADFFAVLDSLCLLLNEFEHTVIEVAGHTDRTGSESYNQTLSMRRAASIASYFLIRDVSSQRVMQIGAGAAHPIAEDDTEHGRGLNRRVEVTLVPITGA